MAELRRIRAAILGLCAIGALICGGCASVHDPEQTRDSLSQVSEDPETPDAAHEYDAQLRPDPIADPLPCSEILVVTVRGTGEPTRGQLLSPVAELIADAHDDVEVVDLDYPADTDVKEGGTLGVRLLIDTLNVQAESCPAQSFALLGYSQGALVIGDALASPDARMVGATVGALNDAAASAVRAVVLYGDPRFLGSEPFDRGDFDPAVNGLLPRPAGSLDGFGDRLLDYCAAADFICQSSLDLNEEGHVSYFENGMQQEGAAFVNELLEFPRIANSGPPDR